MKVFVDALGFFRRRREAWAREVETEAERFLWRARGDVWTAWWAAQHATAELRPGTRAWRLRCEAVAVLQKRCGFVERSGPDTATRMLLRDP